MPQFTTPDGVSIHYEDDYFGPPWARDEAEAVVLLHGIAESGVVWFSWIPQLSGRYRVIRPDLPGFGQSRVPPSLPYEWGPAGFVPDLQRLFDHLQLKRLHLVGAKHGGSVVVDYAARHPEQVLTVTVIGGPVQVRGESSAEPIRRVSGKIKAEGVRKWAEDTMGNRLGSDVSDAQRRFWTDMMGSADARATGGTTDATASLDLLEGLKSIKVPFMFITSRGNKMHPLENFERWTAAAPGTRLVALDSDAYHPAAMLPAECIAAVQPHLQRRTR